MDIQTDAISKLRGCYVWRADCSMSAAPTFLPALETEPFLRFRIHEDAPTLAAHQNKVYMAWHRTGKDYDKGFKLSLLSFMVMIADPNNVA